MLSEVNISKCSGQKIRGLTSENCLAGIRENKNKPTFLTNKKVRLLVSHSMTCKMTSENVTNHIMYEHSRALVQSKP